MLPLEVASINDKVAVILDIGHVYSRVGFAGEFHPRTIVPTPPSIYGDRDKTRAEKKDVVLDFVRYIYFNLLLVNPKERAVVFVENLSLCSNLREIFAEVLFVNYDVPSILFAPSHVLSIMTLGVETALTVELGYKEVLIIPVVSGFSILYAWELAPIGSEAIHKNIKELLISSAHVVDEGLKPLCSLPEIKLTESKLEDLKVRTCFISPKQRAIEWLAWLEKTEQGTKNLDRTDQMPRVAEPSFKYTFQSEDGANVCLAIPSWVRELGPEIMLSGDSECINLPMLILKSLVRCPIDTRKDLAGNLILNGGTTFLPGLKSRLKEELNSMVNELVQFECLRGLKGGFKFHEPPAKPNITSWLGGAIFGSLDVLAQRSLDRQSYMSKRLLPDWTLPTGEDYAHVPSVTVAEVTLADETAR